MVPSTLVYQCSNHWVSPSGNHQRSIHLILQATAIGFLPTLYCSPRNIKCVLYTAAVRHAKAWPSSPPPTGWSHTDVNLISRGPGHPPERDSHGTGQGNTWQRTQRGAVYIHFVHVCVWVLCWEGEQQTFCEETVDKCLQLQMLRSPTTNGKIHWWFPYCTTSSSVDKPNPYWLGCLHVQVEW